MSDSKELKDLLERLRKEAGPAPARAPQAAPVPGPEARPQAAQPAPARRNAAPAFRAWPQEPARHRHGDNDFRAAESKSTWGENREAFLFGLFSSLLVALGGALSGFEYMALVGCCCFAVFAAVMALALYGHSRGASVPAASNGLAERVEALSHKVEALAGKAAPAAVQQAAQPDSRELEKKVEELRVMVRSLAKVVGGEK